MSTRPTTSDAVANVLRDAPPLPSDLEKARIEKKLLAHRPAPVVKRATSKVWPAIGGAIAVAAGIALFVGLSEREPPVAPVARFQVRTDGAHAQRGTLDEGSMLRTGVDEVADVAIGESRVHLDPGSRVRIATLGIDRIGLELLSGSVRVAFHPRQRGREHMAVDTPNARVEVVGTVFRVAVMERQTQVTVSEGVVRVAPVDGRAVRTLRAGERTEVAPAARAAVEEPAISRGQEPAPPVERAQVAPSAPPPMRPADPASELERAREFVEAGEDDRAEPILARLRSAPSSRDVRAEAWTLTGDVHDRAGRFAEAAHAYEEAARAGGQGLTGTNAIYALARLQERRLRDLQSARASYERYLREASTGALAAQAARDLCRLGAQEHCEPTP